MLREQTHSGEARAKSRSILPTPSVGFGELDCDFRSYLPKWGFSSPPSICANLRPKGHERLRLDDTNDGARVRDLGLQILKQADDDGLCSPGLDDAFSQRVLHTCREVAVSSVHIQPDASRKGGRERDVRPVTDSQTTHIHSALQIQDYRCGGGARKHTKHTDAVRSKDLA